MKSDKFIECEGVSNMIEEGSLPGDTFGVEGGDESYADAAKTRLKVTKVIGDGMGKQPRDGLPNIPC